MIGASLLTHNPARPAGNGEGANLACLNSNPPKEIYTECAAAAVAGSVTFKEISFILNQL